MTHESSRLAEEAKQALSEALSAAESSGHPLNHSCFHDAIASRDEVIAIIDRLAALASSQASDLAVHESPNVSDNAPCDQSMIDKAPGLPPLPPSDACIQYGERDCYFPSTVRAYTAAAIESLRAEVERLTSERNEQYGVITELLDQMHHFANADQWLWDESQRDPESYKSWVRSRAAHMLRKFTNRAAIDAAIAGKHKGEPHAGSTAEDFWRGTLSDRNKP